MSATEFMKLALKLLDHCLDKELRRAEELSPVLMGQIMGTLLHEAQVACFLLIFELPFLHYTMHDGLSLDDTDALFIL